MWCWDNFANTTKNTFITGVAPITVAFMCTSDVSKICINNSLADEMHGGRRIAEDDEIVTHIKIKTHTIPRVVISR